jgi:hypothetical protein
MTEIQIVKAWNGKWHLYEKDLEIIPAVVPDGTWYTRIAKPERLMVLTGCGLHVYQRKRIMEVQSGSW